MYDFCRKKHRLREAYTIYVINGPPQMYNLGTLSKTQVPGRQTEEPQKGKLEAECGTLSNTQGPGRKTEAKTEAVCDTLNTHGPGRKKRKTNGTLNGSIDR